MCIYICVYICLETSLYVRQRVNWPASCQRPSSGRKPPPPLRLRKSPTTLENKCQEVFIFRIVSEKGVRRNLKELYPNELPSEFGGDLLVDVFGVLPWKNKEQKIHHKIHGKFQINSWELHFHDQNPHCKDLSLRVALRLETFCQGLGQTSHLRCPPLGPVGVT